MRGCVTAEPLSFAFFSEPVSKGAELLGDPFDIPLHDDDSDGEARGDA